MSEAPAETPEPQLPWTKGPAPEDIAGRRFGAWLVLYRVGATLSRQQLWKCECDCGVRRMVQAGNLKSGRSTRCRSCASRLAAARKRTENGEARDA